MIDICTYRNKAHRAQVIELWKEVFGYQQKRNDPALVIDKKIAMDDDLFFVATDEDLVLGTIMAGYDGHRGWIYSLAVSPEVRGSGLGRRLLAHGEAELIKMGCIKVNLQILQSNESVRDFYQCCGYSVEERISMGKVLAD